MESIEKLGERLEAMEQRARMMERRLRWWRILACGSVVLGVVILPLVGGTAQEQSSYERALARRLAALEYKLQYVSGGPNEVVITGANLRIVNGLGGDGYHEWAGQLDRGLRKADRPDDSTECASASG